MNIFHTKNWKTIMLGLMIAGVGVLTSCVEESTEAEAQEEISAAEQTAQPEVKKTTNRKFRVNRQQYENWKEIAKILYEVDTPLSRETYQKTVKVFEVIKADPNMSCDHQMIEDLKESLNRQSPETKEKINQYFASKGYDFRI